MAENKMIPRMQWASYMNTGTRQAPVWSRIGEGFTELSQTMGAIEYARQFVHEKTERRDVVGYAPKIAYSCDVFSGDPVIARISHVTDAELVGADAQVEIVNVNLYEAPSAGRYPAFKRDWTIIPDTKGRGLDALTMTGIFAATGDHTAGRFSGEGGFLGE